MFSKIMNNVKISVKMMFVLNPPVIALIIISVISVLNISNISKDLIKSLYDETHQSAYWLLNADRDFYQALVAEMDMAAAKTPEELKAGKDAFLENSQQTVERMKNAKDIMSSNKARFEGYKHASSNMNAYELFDAFDKDYAVWFAMFDPEKKQSGR